MARTLESLKYVSSFSFVPLSVCLSVYVSVAFLLFIAFLTACSRMKNSEHKENMNPSDQPLFKKLRGRVKRDYSREMSACDFYLRVEL